MSLRRLAGALRRSDRAVSAVEFALAAPFLILMIVGTFELAHAWYVRTVLFGAVNGAARSSSLQSAQATQDGIDEAVRQAVIDVMPKATVTFDRRNYSEYSDVSRPEDFTDSNLNGEYDTGECFEDENANHSWDEDVAADGVGGAKDVVLYSVNVSYDEMFGIGEALGLPSHRKINASTFLRNQPFATQSTRTTTQVCP